MESLAPPGTEDNISSSTSSFVSKKNSETDRLLSLRYPLPTGGTSNVFELSWQNGSEVWYCRVCRCPVMGQVFNHEAGKRHSSLLETASRNTPRNQVPSAGGNNSKGQIDEISNPVKNQIDWEDVNAIKLDKDKEEKVEVTVAPGEPVPPGFEGEITKVAQIQERLDNFKTSSLIGLEYLLELQDYDQDREPSYLCLLCGKKGDFRTIIPHLVSYNHLQSYLHRHYPLTHAALAPFSSHRKYKKCWQDTVTKIADAIESKYGRMLPHPIDVETYERNRQEVFAKVNKGPHYSESNGCSFKHLVDKEEIIRLSNEAFIEEMKHEKRFTPNAANSTRDKEGDKDKDQRVRRSRRSLSSVSSISSDDFDASAVDIRSTSKPTSSLFNRRRRSKSRSRSRSPYKRRGNAGGNALPWNRPEYRRQDNSKERSREKERTIDRGETKKDEFRRISAAIENDMERQLRQHQMNPEKHSQYNEEWKVFWNKRYKELQNEGKDTQGYDFKPEWIIHWNKKMEEFHKAEVKAKIDALRRRLGLAEVAPISFKINTSSTTSSSLRRRETKLLACQPVAAQPDQDHEVIIIEDSRDDTRRRTRDNREDSHSPWESDNGNSPRKDFRRRQAPARRAKNAKSASKSRSRSLSPSGNRRGRYTRRRTRSRSRSRSKSKRYNRRSRSRSKTPLIRRNVDKSLEAPRHSDESWDRAVSFKAHQQNLPPIPFKHNKDVIMVRESTLKKQVLLDEQITAVEDLGGDVNIIAVLRLLTALEDKLGSLGPKVVDLLASALSLEKKTPNSSELLLDDEANCVMFETIKEKLKGLLHAGLVAGYSSQEKAIKTSITKIAGLLHIASKRKTETEAKRASTLSIDKAAIAQQIATALVLQGKTDVTQSELEQLIRAVVSMAETSRDTAKPITTASFLEMRKQNKKTNEGIANCPKTSKDADKTHDLTKEPHKNEKEVAKDKERDAMDGLSDLELQTLLQSFKDLSAEEQHGLISYLKKLEAKEPARVETLRKFVNLESATSTNVNTNRKQDDMNVNMNRKPENVTNEGRISPFSKKLSENTNIIEDQVVDSTKSDAKAISDDDEDYSYEDVFKAANKNLNEQTTDVSSLIANIMVSIASNTKTNSSVMTTTANSATFSGSHQQQQGQNQQQQGQNLLQQGPNQQQHGQQQQQQGQQQQRLSFNINNSNPPSNVNMNLQRQQQQPFRQFPPHMQQGNVRPLMSQNMPNIQQTNNQQRFYPNGNSGNNDNVNYNNYYNRW